MLLRGFSEEIEWGPASCGVPRGHQREQSPKATDRTGGAGRIQKYPGDLGVRKGFLKPAPKHKLSRVKGQLRDIRAEGFWSVN